MPRKLKNWVSEGHYIVEGKDWWLGVEPFNLNIRLYKLPPELVGKHLRIRIEEVVPPDMPRDKTPINSIERHGIKSDVDEAKLKLSKLWGEDNANKPNGRSSRRKKVRGKGLTSEEYENIFSSTEFFN
jgi:hypothetical protein